MLRPYSSEVLEHLGLVAEMFEELGIGAVIDQATQRLCTKNDTLSDVLVQEAILH